MRLRFREMEVLHALMQGGSTVAAAERLGVTQPAISKMLQQTEERLGFACFGRVNGRLSPTPEARAMLPEILKVVTAFDTMQRFAEDLRASNVGLLSIAAAPALATGILPRVLRSFQAGSPDVRIHLLSLTNHEVIRQVAEHYVDLGFILTPALDSQTQVLDLCTADLCCVVPVDHPLAAVDAVTPALISSHPLICLSRDKPVGMVVERVFERLGVRCDVRVEATQSAAAIALVQAGMGVALLDGFALIHPPHGLVVRPFRPLTQVKCRQIWSSQHALSRIAAVFAGHLGIEVKSMQEKGLVGPAG